MGKTHCLFLCHAAELTALYLYAESSRFLPTYIYIHILTRYSLQVVAAVAFTSVCARRSPPPPPPPPLPPKFAAFVLLPSASPPPPPPRPSVAPFRLFGSARRVSGRGMFGRQTKNAYAHTKKRKSRQKGGADATESVSERETGIPPALSLSPAPTLHLGGCVCGCVGVCLDATPPPPPRGTYGFDASSSSS